MIKSIIRKRLGASLLTAMLTSAAWAGAPAYAQDDTAAPPRAALMGLARDFVNRVGGGFDRADRMLSAVAPAATAQEQTRDRINSLPDGEILLLRPLLPRRFAVDGVVTGEIDKPHALLSLRDFVDVLQFPIDYNAETGDMRGWYIRDDRPFVLEAASRSVVTSTGTFVLSDNVRMQDGDYLVPYGELASWFGFDLTPDVSVMELQIDPGGPLPFQERLQRMNREFADNRIPPPALPPLQEDIGVAGVPFVDVSTSSRYYRPGEGKTTTRHTANVRTSGQLGPGRLETLTQFSDENQLTALRANYKVESPEKELLGPLKARRYEVGDLVPTQLPLANNFGQSLGVRVSNVNPLRNYNRPTTEIIGNITPGWEVELYRDSQFLGYKLVGDDGFFSFEDVQLYQGDNNFRIVKYGPQGEVEEELRYVPADPRLAAQGEGAYDVSLTFDNTQTYNKLDSGNDPDEGQARLNAYYEQPIGESTALIGGFRSVPEEGERRNYLHGGVSTTLGGFLVNANMAVDDQMEMNTQLATRRGFGNHDFYNTAEWATAGYENPLGTGDPIVFRNTGGFTGPLPVSFVKRPGYTVSYDYNEQDSGNTSYSARAGVYGSVGRVTMTQNFSYLHNDAVPDDTAHSVTTLAGSWGRNRIRFNADYEIMPDSALDSMAAIWQHRFSRDLDTELEVRRRIDPSYTEATAQVNWQAGPIRLSPSVSYDTDGDLTAMLNTRFGAIYEPQGGGVRMFGESLTGTGALSALVYLDRNGNNIFDEGDEPIPGAVVRSLHTGGRAETDEEGIAFIRRMGDLILTDVYVEPGSLQDPFWIPGTEGASIMPREGHVTRMQFPVHIAGEMDGTIYVRTDAGETRALRGMDLHLYDPEGVLVKSTATGPDGFYLFDLIPPGEYVLMLDKDDAQGAGIVRPAPQQINIGYDGTIIYGNDITVAQGQDVPVDILAADNPFMTDFIARHPHVDLSAMAQDQAVVLNLGAYRSQMLMALTWYKIKMRYGNIVAGAQLLVRPSESYAGLQDGKHHLLVYLPHDGLNSAAQRCRSLAARGIECAVDIMPSGIEAAALESLQTAAR